MAKKQKKKLNIRGIIIILLIIYVIIMLFLYVFRMPIKNIIVTGNENVLEYTIIKDAKINDYPSLYKFTSNKMEKNIKKNPLIKSVEIKKTFFGKVSINVIENKILFFNRNNNKIILSGGIEIDELKNQGMPVLNNYVPDKVYDKMVKYFEMIDTSVIGMISEIEYSPLYSGDVIIDDQRFMLMMNDGNTVYVNTVNIEQLNSYPSFYATLDNNLGILYLDSSTKENFYFQPYKNVKASE